MANRIKSDHAPIEMKLRWKGKIRKENREKRGEEVRRVMRWNPEGITDDVKKLEKHGKARNWTEIKEKVLTTIPRLELRGKKEDCYEEKWWDGECHSKKVELNEVLKGLRRGEISEEEWRKRRREYKNFMENKKWNEGKEWLIELEKDKGMKLFSETVRTNKRNGAQPDSSIIKERWRDYFREQYILEETIEELTEGRETAVEEEEGERMKDISVEEVKETIRNLKKKKAAGQDQIPNEAWIHGEKQLAEELTTALNEIWSRGEVPKEWKTGLIKPIYKKGDKKEVGNYRGITLMDTGYKIYAEIIRK